MEATDRKQLREFVLCNPTNRVVAYHPAWMRFIYTGNISRKRIEVERRTINRQSLLV